MATHSSIFAWRIPGAGEPGGLLNLLPGGQPSPGAGAENDTESGPPVCRQPFPEHIEDKGPTGPIMAANPQVSASSFNKITKQKEHVF